MNAISSPRQSPMQELCPYCQQTLSGDRVTLWDEREYCRQCVEGVSPRLHQLALGHELLQESIPRTALRFTNLCWPIGRQMAVIVGAVMSCGILWGVITVGVGQLPALLVMLALIGVPLTLFLVFLAGVTSVLCWLLLRPQMPRTILFDHYGLAVCVSGKVERCGLAECTWQDGETTGDIVANLAGVRRGVTIQIRSGNYAVGYAPENAELFRAFLKLARVKERPAATFRGYMAAVVAGCTLGSLLGLLAGAVASSISNDDEWLPRLVWLGLIDGLLGGTYVARLRFHHASKARRPWVTMLLFIVTGYRIGARIDAPTGITLAIANATVGAFIAWLCQRALAKESSYPEESG